MSVVLVAATALPAPALAISPPRVTVPSSLIMTMDGELAWSRHPDASRAVASCIKMLNALVVRQQVADLDETATVPRQAAAITDGGVGLKTGQRITVRKLLEIMLVASANDAAEALAIHIGGTQSHYVAMMNAEAKKLGLVHTHAVDPHGLGKKERSTANDLSVLARDVMADPVLHAIVGEHSVVVPRLHGKHSTVASTNLLYGHYKGIEGVKTGYTIPAGYCFVGAARRGSVELLGVVMGATSLSGRFSQMRILLDWGFAHIHTRTLVSRATTEGVVAVAGGVDTTISVHPSKDATKTLYDGGGSLITSVSLPATITAPVRRGQTVGTVTVYRRGVKLASVPLVADEGVSALLAQELVSAFAPAAAAFPPLVSSAPPAFAKPPAR